MTAMQQETIQQCNILKYDLGCSTFPLKYSVNEQLVYSHNHYSDLAEFHSRLYGYPILALEVLTTTITRLLCVQYGVPVFIELTILIQLYNLRLSLQHTPSVLL